MPGCGYSVWVSRTVELMAALQARWEESLRERAAVVPHSPVPLLDGLLASYRQATLPPITGASRS
jgi:hypothetical protein